MHCDWCRLQTDALWSWPPYGETGPNCFFDNDSVFFFYSYKSCERRQHLTLIELPMLMQAYFDFAHSIRALRNAAMLSCGMKKCFFAFECARRVTATKIIHPSYMSTSVIAGDPRDIHILSQRYCFFGEIIATQSLGKKKKKTFPFPDFSHIFQP